MTAVDDTGIEAAAVTRSRLPESSKCVCKSDGLVGE